MQWNLKSLKKLLSNVQKHKVQQVRIIDDRFDLFINTLQTSITDAPILSHNYDTTQYAPETTKTESYVNITNDQNTKYLTIISPMVGTFYRASNPEESPFIDIQDQVTYHQTVCIIEAMKLMNEIEAEVDGKIIDILVTDGEFVDCGQPLMIVEPTNDPKLKSNS